MGTGLASWTTEGKSSIWFILSVCAGWKVAADQGITQVTLISHIHFVTSRPMQELGPLQPVSEPQTNMQ